MQEVLKAKAQGLVISDHYQALRLFVDEMIREAQAGSVVGKTEFDTIRNAVRRDAFVEALSTLIDRLEKAASEARVTARR